MDWDDIESALPGDEVLWLIKGWQRPPRLRRRLKTLRRFYEAELAAAEARVAQMTGAIRQLDDYISGHGMLGSKHGARNAKRPPGAKAPR